MATRNSIQSSAARAIRTRIPKAPKPKAARPNRVSNRPKVMVNKTNNARRGLKYTAKKVAGGTAHVYKIGGKRVTVVVKKKRRF